jgi:hypothetical protein
LQPIIYKYDGIFKKQETMSRDGTFHLERYCKGKRRFNCQFGTKIVVNVAKKTAVLYISGQHDHSKDLLQEDQHRKKTKSGTWGISHNVRPFIDQKLKENKTAKQIMRDMRSEKLGPEPEMDQLQNYLFLKKQVLKPELKSENISSFLEWLRDNQFRPELPDEELFVLPGAIIPEEIKWNSDPSDLRVVCAPSTKALLANAIRQQDSSLPAFLCIDSTYNLLVNRWPTPVIGTLDWRHRYRTISVTLSSHEDEEAITAALDKHIKGESAVLSRPRN